MALPAGSCNANAPAYPDGLFRRVNYLLPQNKVFKYTALIMIIVKMLSVLIYNIVPRAFYSPHGNSGSKTI